jgi:hypothetical protein
VGFFCVRPLRVGGELDRGFAVFNRLEQGAEIAAGGLRGGGAFALGFVGGNPRGALVLQMGDLFSGDAGERVDAELVHNALRGLHQVGAVAVELPAYEVISERNAVGAGIFLLGGFLDFAQRGEEEVRGLEFIGRGVLRGGAVLDGLGGFGAGGGDVVEQVGDVFGGDLAGVEQGGALGVLRGAGDVFGFVELLHVGFVEEPAGAFQFGFRAGRARGARSGNFVFVAHDIICSTARMRPRLRFWIHLPALAAGKAGFRIATAVPARAGRRKNRGARLGIQ